MFPKFAVTLPLLPSLRNIFLFRTVFLFSSSLPGNAVGITCCHFASFQLYACLLYALEIKVGTPLSEMAAVIHRRREDYAANIK
jgi:hypothetical protein